MSQQRAIHQADLRHIESNLSNLNHSVEHVYHYVMELQKKVQTTDQKLEKLSNDFQNYLQGELKMKQLQLAETRLIRVRQRVEKKFGHYDNIRRQATGILQAVDAGVVRDEVLSQSAEELMIGAPRYWLAPCLVALSAWIGNRRELAEKALQEALKRDNEKTSLFFALVTRRSERLEASNQWLERYFQLQDPFALDREVIILIDAFTNGVFVPAARDRCEQQMIRWVNDLSQMAGNEQHRDWIEIFDQFTQLSETDDYPYLKQVSPTWNGMQQALNRAKSHQGILEFFQHVFTGDVRPVNKVSEAVDQILAHLVTGFDDEELPVREEDRRLSLIIQSEGDKEQAEQQFATEKTAWLQKFHFKDVLKTLSFSPQAVQATKATQQFAIAFCKEWIQQAHADFTAKNRQAFPNEVEFIIHGWRGTTRDGKNQEELIRSLLDQMEKEAEKSNAYPKVKRRHWLSAVIGGSISLLGVVLSFFTPLGFVLLLLGLLGPFYLLYTYRKSHRAYEKHKKSLQQEAKNLLLASIAEVVDWRREVEKKDQQASEVEAYLANIQKDQYVKADFDQTSIL